MAVGRFDAVVFDCGGTLLELSPSREEICARALASLGIEVEIGFLRRAYEVVEFALPQLASRLGDPSEKRAYYDRFNRELTNVLGLRTRLTEINRALQRQFSLSRSWRPMEGVFETLGSLSQRAQLHVLANWDQGLPSLLARVELAPFFASIGTSAGLGVEKPKAEIFTMFAREAGINPAGAVYVGNDYVADVVGARAAGFEAVLCDFAGRYPPSVDCHVVSSLAKLLDVIPRL